VTQLVFFVPGRPQTAGSKQAFVNKHTGRAQVVESGDRDAKAAWRADIQTAASNASKQMIPDGTLPWPWDGPLRVSMVFVRNRPAGHFGTGRNAGKMKDGRQALRPVQRPDALKLARAAEDALTGWLWADDSQIVEEHLYKAFPDQVGLQAGAEGLLMSVEAAGEYRGPRLAQQT
jgi:Holliday junction resolvase RusA-like endonuclease